MATADISESTARANFIPYLRIFWNGSKLSTSGKNFGEMLVYYDARWPGFVASFGKLMHGINRGKVQEVAELLASSYGDTYPDPAVWNSAMLERVGTTTWGDLAGMAGDVALDTANDITTATSFGAGKLFQAVLVGVVVWFLVQAIVMAPKGKIFRSKRAKA